MITSLILLMLYGVIWVLISPFRLLPNASLPANITSAITTANTYISAIDFIFPVATFITVFGLILTIEAFIILWKILNWIIHKIPTIS